MTVTATSFKAKARFAAFSGVANATVTEALEEAADRIDAAAFGNVDLYDRALEYLAAHLLALDGIAGGKSTPKGTVNAGPSGTVASRRSLGDSISYSAPAPFGDDPLARTEWGRRYLELADATFPTRVL